MSDQGDAIEVLLRVNGEDYPLRLEPWVTLLDALRERLQLTATKKGCDHGQCGACTVLADGRPILSCLALAASWQGASIATVEGSQVGAVRALQQAFVDRDALQCGFCTPGQIIAAVELVEAEHEPDEDAIREAMSGNLCRCGAYPNIVAAIRQARRAFRAAPPSLDPPGR